MNKPLLKKFTLATRRRLLAEAELALGQQKEQKLVAEQLRLLGRRKLTEQVAAEWFNRLATERYEAAHQSRGESSKAQRQSAKKAQTAKMPKRTLGDSLGQTNELMEWSELAKILTPPNLAELRAEFAKLPDAEFASVEVFGWLYQYYQTETKSAAVATKRPYQDYELPYVTQLFTPDWLVGFLLDETLGRFAAELGLDEKTGQEKTSVPQPSKKTQTVEYSGKIDPRVLKFLDPCCGSGHILVQAFERFYQIYRACGYQPSEIPALVLRHNLYGLEIDQRAASLARAAVLLKAREYDSDIAQKITPAELPILAVPDSRELGKGIILQVADFAAREEAYQLFDFFDQASELGALLLPPTQPFVALKNYLATAPQPALQSMLKVCELLQQTYDFVVTNPPYVNSARMNQNLKQYVTANFPAYKRDLFAAFVYRNSLLAKPGGYLGYVTPSVWLFTATYQKLRQFVLHDLSLKALVQPAPGAFFQEATVDICAFAAQNLPDTGEPASFIKLDAPGDMTAQARQFTEVQKTHDAAHYFVRQAAELAQLPGQVMAYWLSDWVMQLFRTAPTLASFAEPKQGMITGNNAQFLRFWYEVNPTELATHAKTAAELTASTKAVVKLTTRAEPAEAQNPAKWFPHNKGGEFRKWYGNREYVVDYEANGRRLRNFKRDDKLRSRPQNLAYNFRTAISWSAVTSGEFSARLYDEHFTFSGAGLSCFPPPDQVNYLLGLLNSKVASYLAQALNPTLNLNVGDLAKMPVLIDDTVQPEVEQLVQENLELSQQDYDSFELSPDFTLHPLLKQHKSSLAAAFASWQAECQARYTKLRANETRLNQIFLKLYRLENELTPTIEDAEITLRLADRRREVKSLLSFFVGWLFGRYQTLDQAPRPTLNPSPYIIYLRDEVFLITKLAEFLNRSFGAANLAENLAFLATELQPELGERPSVTILRYLRERFFADHCQLYHRKPIYWLVDSGKSHTFRALLYLHNYQPAVLAELRSQVAPVQHRLRVQASDLATKVAAANKSDHMIYQRQLKSLTARQTELAEFDERLSALASAAPRLNPDAGVVANHAKLQSILAKIPTKHQKSAII